MAIVVKFTVVTVFLVLSVGNSGSSNTKSSKKAAHYKEN